MSQKKINRVQTSENFHLLFLYYNQHTHTRQLPTNRIVCGCGSDVTLEAATCGGTSSLN